MALTADFHMHSHYSGDSSSNMEDMIVAGIEKGLAHLCFTEHHDIGYVNESGEPDDTFTLNTDSYLYELAILKEKYRSKVQILFGVELGIQPQVSRELLSYSKSYDFDFIIASAHLCNKKDPYYPSFFEGRTDREAYQEYFEATLASLKGFTNYDVLGHLDYVVRYGNHENQAYSYQNHADVIDEILKLLIENEKGLEVNTGGFRAGLNAPNPCASIIKRYKELGGEIITAGSDAHIPQHIADNFHKTSDLLKSLGFRYYATYENRMPEMHSLL